IFLGHLPGFPGQMDGIWGCQTCHLARPFAGIAHDCCRIIFIVSLGVGSGHWLDGVSKKRIANTTSLCSLSNCRNGFSVASWPTPVALVPEPFLYFLL